MSTIKDTALTYEAPSMKNISELEVIRTEMDLELRKFKEGTEEEFTSYVITVNNQEYRMPNSVLTSLKAILEHNPNLKCFQVKREGQGLKTKYTVIPLE